MTPRGTVAERPFSEERVVEVAITAVESALKTIHDDIATAPDALTEYFNDELKKHVLGVDLRAERTARDLLAKLFEGKIEIRGEETSLERVGDVSLAALLDMLDGSDLLKRKLGNWCSAMVLFDTKESKIITALVGMPDKEIYFTQHSQPGAFVKNDKGTIETIKINDKAVEFKDAAIAFYGQKPTSLLAIYKHRRFVERLTEIAREVSEKKRRDDCPKLRIYNLAGNPIMMSLIEGRIDAIVETSGQKCHDVVPGFVIALRAGASLVNLDGEKITEKFIAEQLPNPSYKFTYVMARTPALAAEITLLLHA